MSHFGQSDQFSSSQISDTPWENAKRQMLVSHFDTHNKGVKTRLKPKLNSIWVIHISLPQPTDQIVLFKWLGSSLPEKLLQMVLVSPTGGEIDPHKWYHLCSLGNVQHLFSLPFGPTVYPWKSIIHPKVLQSARGGVRTLMSHQGYEHICPLLYQTLQLYWLSFGPTSPL